MVMTAHTLHLLAAAPKLWSTLLPEIEAVWQHGDQLLLLAAGAAGVNRLELSRFDAVALLDTDAAVLSLNQADIPARVQYATASDWATWTLDYPRTITWR